MPQTLTQPKNPEFEKARRRGPNGRFIADDGAGAASSQQVRADDNPLSQAGSERSIRLDAVLARHRNQIKQVAARHDGKSIALVGSVARGEDTEDSDYDFLIRFGDQATLFTMASLKRELEDILGGKVDLTIDGKQFRDGRCAASMLKDAIPL